MPNKYEGWPKSKKKLARVPKAKNKKRFYAKKAESAEWWMTNGHKFGRPGKGKAHPKQQPNYRDWQNARKVESANETWKKYRMWEQKA